MNRRDTIIIAVLLNAGVLALLFMLAINDNEAIDDYSGQTPPRSELTYARQPKVEPQKLAEAKQRTDEFVEMNIDDSPLAMDDSPLLMEQYTFVNEPEELIPSKPFQPPSPVTPPMPSEPYVEVTVKRGDSLDKIARSNGTTIEAIKKVNNLKSDNLSVGQILKVPTSQKASQAAIKQVETKKPVADNGSAVYYTVKTGDSPWKIAKQNNMNVDDLLKLNNLNEEKARNLKVGDKIRIK